MSNSITLSAENYGGATVISNIFFDEYLSKANGEFLKIYLYLQRWASTSPQTLTPAHIADALLMTENDVCRGLRYWEQEGLLRLGYDSDHTLSSICLLTVRSKNAQASPVTQPVTRTHSSSSNFNAPVSYPVQQLNSFVSGDGEQLIFIIQQYLGHLLSPKDLNIIYYFYDELHFSLDLIEYLFEYCVSNAHRDMRYIEKVALSWAQQQITTPDAARTYTENHQRTAFAVLKAFGITGRIPTSGETAYVNKWTRTYGFNMELVLEACRRTIMAVHVPSFEYTDKILSNWKSQGLSSMEEIAAADKVFETNAKATKDNKTAEAKITVKASRSSANKFHNFKQRSYDYDDLEQKLTQRARTTSNSHQ